MKNLVKLMTDFTYQNGLEVSRVFDDLLRYIIQGYTLPGHPGLKDWHNSLIPEQFYGACKINQDLNNPFSKFWGIPHIQPIGWEDTSIKKMLDGMSKVTRIQKHLKESAEKHLARFKSLRRQKVLTNEEKQEAKAELMKYNNIKRALRKHGKKQQH